MDMLQLTLMRISPGPGSLYGASSISKSAFEARSHAATFRGNIASNSF